jgi:hypothetical protein
LFFPVDFRARTHIKAQMKKEVFSKIDSRLCGNDGKQRRLPLPFNAERSFRNAVIWNPCSPFKSPEGKRNFSVKMDTLAAEGRSGAGFNTFRGERLLKDLRLRGTKAVKREKPL